MNKKYLAAAAIVSGMSFLPLANPASATTVTSNQVTIPVYLNVASGAVATYDVVISENISMTQSTADSNTATVTDLVIKNQADAAPVFVTKVLATGKNPYTVESYSTTAFPGYPVDSKKIALRGKFDGEGEGSFQDIKDGWTGKKEIAADDGTATMSFQGLTSQSLNTIEDKEVASCVVTLSLTEPTTTTD